MELKNGYTVIYNGTGTDGKNHLFATKTTSEAGVQLTYKKPDGTELTTADLEKVKLFYEKDNEDGNRAIFYSTTGISDKADEEVLVYAGTDLVLGQVSSVDALANKKKTSKKALETVVDKTKYDAADQTTIDQHIADGKAAIDAATTIAKVNEELTTYKNKILAIKTTAQKALATAKTTAINTLTSYKNTEINALEATAKTSAKAAKEEGKTNINTAKNSEEVTSALNAAKAAVDAIISAAAGPDPAEPTDEEL